jgi:hypothetical protein
MSSELRSDIHRLPVLETTYITGFFLPSLEEGVKVTKVVKALLLCELWILTSHFEQPAGAKILWWLFPLAQFFLQLKCSIFVLYFLPAPNLSFSYLPTILYMIVYATLLVWDTVYRTFWRNFFHDVYFAKISQMSILYSTEHISCMHFLPTVFTHD